MALAVESETTSNVAGQTTHTVNLPATISASALILVLIATDNSPGTITGPSGYEILFEINVAAVGDFLAYYKEAVGNEDGGTITFGTGNSTESSHIVMSITGWDTATAPEAGTEQTTAASTVVDHQSGAFNPTGWGSEETLWIACGITDAGTNTTVSAYPTNYTNGVKSNQGAGTGGCGVFAARRLLTAASEDPGTSTLGATDDNIGQVIAIRPSGAGPTGQGPLSGEGGLVGAGGLAGVAGILAA